MNQEIISHIRIDSDLEKLRSEILDEYKTFRTLVFFPENFLIDDAHQVIKESSIAEASLKIIVLLSKNFNIYAQNALLKSLEEPPRNTVFILGSTSKMIFLPTIRSRMPIYSNITTRLNKDIELNLENLNLKDVYSFIQKHQQTNSTELCELLQMIVINACKCKNIKLKEEDLVLFENLFKLASLHTRSQVLISTLLLTIMKRKI